MVSIYVNSSAKPAALDTAAVTPSLDPAAQEGADIAFGSLGQFNAGFARIFGELVESGAHIRAAVRRPALIIASDPTRNGNTHEGENANV